jgi:hypothetical protein
VVAVSLNHLMLYGSPSLDSISGWPMTIELKINHTSWEHYTTAILSNVYRSCLHIAHFWSRLNLNRSTLQTQKVTEYKVRWTFAGGCERSKISFLPERQLFGSFLHPTRPTWPISQAMSLSGHWNSSFAILGQISPVPQQSAPASVLG